MKYLYYCNSPYQLFNIINLNWHRKYDNFENISNYNADLIISNTFSSSNELYEILKKDDMFSNVFLCNRLRNKNKLHKISTFLDFVFPNRYISKTTGINSKNFTKKYDCLCMPKVSSLMLAIWTKNSKARIDLIDEGFGTYRGGKRMTYEKSTHQWIYELINGGKKLVDSFERIYVNSTSLYLDNDVDRLIEIPKISDACLDKLITLFNEALIKEPKNHIFWLGQYIKDNVNNVTNDSLEVVKDEVVYIPHPRMNARLSSTVDDSFKRMESNKFWELNLAKIPDIENKCFISMHSTAMFSPKLLYDKEPYLILTYHMIEDPFEREGCEFINDIIYMFVSLYRNPEKIMLPKNIKELDECIELYIKKANLV